MKSGKRGPMKKKTLVCEDCTHEFERSSSHKAGGKLRCASCKEKYYLTAYPTRYHADRYAKRLYNLTPEAVDALLTFQKQGCAICTAPASEQPKRFAVDHDHVTGKVRGLLCDRCNRCIGLAGDSPERLRNAAQYLERPPAKVIGEPVVNLDEILKLHARRNFKSAMQRAFVSTKGFSSK